MSFYSLFNITDAEYQALTATELQLTGSTYVSTSNSHITADSSSTATSSAAPIINQIQQQIQQQGLLTQLIWFSISVVLEVAVDEEAALLSEFIY